MLRLIMEEIDPLCGELRESWRENFCKRAKLANLPRKRLKGIFDLAFSLAMRKSSSVGWNTQKGQEFTKAFGLVAIWYADLKDEECIFVAIRHLLHEKSVITIGKVPYLVSTDELFKTFDSYETGTMVLFSLIDTNMFSSNCLKKDYFHSGATNAEKSFRNVGWIVRDAFLAGSFGRGRNVEELKLCFSEATQNSILPKVCKTTFLSDSFWRTFCCPIAVGSNLHLFLNVLESFERNASHSSAATGEEIFSKSLDRVVRLGERKPRETLAFAEKENEKVTLRPFVDGDGVFQSACYELTMMDERSEGFDVIRISPVGVVFVSRKESPSGGGTSESANSGCEGTAEEERITKSDLFPLGEKIEGSRTNWQRDLFGSFGSALRSAKISAMLFELSAFLQTGSSIAVGTLTKYQRLHSWEEEERNFFGKCSSKCISEIEIKGSIGRPTCKKCFGEGLEFKSFECSLDEALDFVRCSSSQVSFFQSSRGGLSIVRTDSPGKSSNFPGGKGNRDRFWDCFRKALNCVEDTPEFELSCIDAKPGGGARLCSKPTKTSLWAHRNCSLKIDHAFLFDLEILYKRISLGFSLSVGEFGVVGGNFQEGKLLLEDQGFVATCLDLLCKQLSDLEESSPNADLQFELFEDSTFLNFPTNSSRYVSKSEGDSIRSRGLDHSRYGIVGFLDENWKTRYFPSDRSHHPSLQDPIVQKPEEKNDADRRSFSEREGEGNAGNGTNRRKKIKTQRACGSSKPRKVFLTNSTFERTREKMESESPNPEFASEFSEALNSFENWKWLARVVGIGQLVVRLAIKRNDVSALEVYKNARARVLSEAEKITRKRLSSFCFPSPPSVEDEKKRKLAEVFATLSTSLNTPGFSHPSIAMEIIFDIFSSLSDSESKDFRFPKLECRWSHGENTPNSLLGILQRSLFLRDVRLNRFMLFSCTDARFGTDGSTLTRLFPCAYFVHLVLLEYDRTGEDCISSHVYPSSISVLELYNSLEEASTSSTSCLELDEEFFTRAFVKVISPQHLDSILFPHLQSCIWFEF